MAFSPRAQPYFIASMACVTLACSAGYDLYREREQAIRSARAHTAGLAALLDEHVHQLLRRADAKLDELARAAPGSPAHLLSDGVIVDASVVAPAGQGVDRRRPEGPAWIELLRRAEPGAVVIGAARKGATGSWILPLGKRVPAAGVAPEHLLETLVDLQSLQHLLDAVDTRSNGFVTLFSTDGWLLATAPANDKLFARNWGDTPMFEEHLPHSPTGTVQQVVVRDGTERVYSYRRVPDFPAVISVGISLTDALAAWRLRLLWDAILMGVVSSAFFAGAFGMSRTIARREEAQQAMVAARNEAQGSETFLRTVTDNLPLRIAYVDAALRYRFVNRAHCLRFGLERHQILGHSREELTGKALPPAMHAAIERVMAGQAQSFEIEESDSSGRHVLATHLVPDVGVGGKVIGFYAASIDVTDRFEQRLRIDAALVERETLLREVYHRVKNNLQVIQSLLRLQRRTVTDVAAQSALDESARRVRAMAMVHEKLYQSGSLEAVSLRDYTLELLEFLGEATGAHARGVLLRAEVEPLEVRLEAAIPYGLLVNELVSNSLKHGYPDGRRGTVTLRVERRDGGLNLRVADDGIGLPPRFSVGQDASMGLQLAASLAAQLGGQLTAHNEAGAVFSVDLTAFR
jgi:PAS domain S-box-containing protein